MSKPNNPKERRRSLSVKQAVEQAVLEHNWHDEHALTVLCDFIFTRGPACVNDFHQWLADYIAEQEYQEDRDAE